MSPQTMAAQVALDLPSLTGTPPVVDLGDPRLYINREMSLLEFQRRVLGEARDSGNPLLERVKFLSIFMSNLDEFFMVRVAGLMQQVENKVQDLSADGQNVTQQLEAIGKEVRELVSEAYRLYREFLLPALGESGIHIIEYSALAPEQRSQLESYFLKSVFPVLTPLAFDPGRPFPHISSLSLNLAVGVRDGGGVERFARVKVPGTLAQLVSVPTAGHDSTHGQTYIWLEQLITANLKYLFPEVEIFEAHPFHVTRDAEIAIQEIESDDLLETVEEAVWQRRFRDVVRLQVEGAMPRPILEILTSNLELEPAEIYQVQGPLDLGRLRQLLSLDRPELKDKPFLPFTPILLQPKSEEDMFSVIRREDVLLHHPFDSFQPVIEFLRRAARDPDVLAIKMTLYRLGRNSPVVDALLEAVENGKQVAVLVELKARFDEESNIEWARQMEREGVHVVYGLVGLKVHSKVAMVVRQEGDTIRRYVHLATGNYNAITARTYTDLGFFTTDEQIGADVTDLFNYLTGYSRKRSFRKLLVAPINLRQRLEELIRREIDVHRHGGETRLIFKMNALEDQPMIKLLYEASQAGVQVDLLVRGICCLRSGLPGISENIRVTSVVGRFLEHSRIFYFHNGGHEQVFLGSADLMPRNLNRRVEVLFPVENPKLIHRLRDDILATYLADEAKARFMRADGAYTRPPDRDDGIDSQQWLLNQRAREGNWVV